MINNKLLRNKLDFIVDKLLKTRKFKLNTNKFIYYEKRRKLLNLYIKSLQTKKNKLNKIFINKNFDNEIKNNIFLHKQINEKINNLKKILKKINNKINYILLNIPNLLDDSVPLGNNFNENKIIKYYGNIKIYNFNVKNHIELGKIDSGIDFESASKISGSKFVVLRNNIAYLHRVLCNFMLDIHTIKHKYKEINTPCLVKYESMYGTGQLPKFNKDLFYVSTRGNNSKLINKHILIPTSEVSLTNLLRNEIIDEKLLPLKMVSNTPCFRSEAGSYGKNSKGLIRLHQFDKVELVQIVLPENSNLALEEITNHAEIILKLLEIPYRKVLLCSGDTGFSSSKTYDLEVWFPSKKKYIEISSCSNMSDFQSRRMKIRYKNKKTKKINLVHTLNASGLAVSRTLAAILENYQNSEGKIKIPHILKPYMNNMSFLN